MGLFDQPLQEIRSFVEDKYAGGLAHELPFTPVLPLSDAPRSSSARTPGWSWEILGGLPLAALVGRGEWRGRRPHHPGWPDSPSPTRPAFPSPRSSWWVASSRTNTTATATCATPLQPELRGFMTRVFPGRQSIWCRVSKEAMAAGFNAQILGSSLIQAMKKLDFVNTAEVILVTASKAEVDKLSEAADKVLDIVEALIKMYEEMNFDCEECEYVEVCDEVVELRQIRERLKGERKQGVGPWRRRRALEREGLSPCAERVGLARPPCPRYSRVSWRRTPRSGTGG